MAPRGIAAAAILATVSASQYAVSDAPGLGRVLDGYGGISGGGGCSRLLIDYPEVQRSQILDYLFLPNFGASLSILKVEIGGDGDSTNGAEACHRRLENETDLHRGYEWWIMQEAKARNPNITLFALPWTWPGYLMGDTGAHGARGNPWSNLSLTADYVVSWIAGARSEYGLEIDYVGIWNEVGYNTTYMPVLRAALDAAGFGATRVIAADMFSGQWEIAVDVAASPALQAAVHTIGVHYPGSKSTPVAQNLSKPLWASEDNSEGGMGGGACAARALNENYVNGLITASCNWALVTAFYEGIRWWGAMLMNAAWPWSGAFQLNPALWSTAHYSQFAYPGWSYLAHGSGVGYLSGGGTYSALTPPGAHELTIVIEKLNRASSACGYGPPPPNETTPELVTLELGGSFAGVSQLYVWYSNYSDPNVGSNPDLLFQPLAPLSVSSGVVTLQVNVGDLYTLTTLSTGHHGSYVSPPSAPFPVPYADDFNSPSYNASGMPRYWSNLNGGFELADSGDAARGLVLQQRTVAEMVRWVTDATHPISVLGDAAVWENIDAQLDFLVVNAGGSAVVGVRAAGDIDLLPGVWLSLTAGAGGQWNVSASVQNVSRAAAPPVASGPLPNGGILPGTWHTLRALANGSLVSFFLDGAALVAINTSAYAPAVTFPPSGWLGIGSLQWSDVTWFDNVTVTGLPDTCALGKAAVHTNATLRTCDAANPNARLIWSPVNASAGQLGLLSSGGSLCLGTWGVYPHTGALSVATVLCDAGDATQVWTLEQNATLTAASPPLAPARLINAATGQCLEYPGTQAGDGTRVETWACHSGSNPPDGNQLWLFDSQSPAGNGSALQSVLSGLCVALCD